MWIESEPSRSLREAWVYLTPEEGHQLLHALRYWADEDPADPEWHTHITDADREFTLAIGPEVGTDAFARRVDG